MCMSEQRETDGSILAEFRRVNREHFTCIHFYFELCLTDPLIHKDSVYRIHNTCI